MAEEDHSENRVTIWLSTELKDEMDDCVDWRNSSRSEWIRDAIRFRIQLNEALDDADLELPDDQAERESMMEEIVETGVREYSGDQ